MITSVFTFGSALGQVAAVLAGQVTALGVAAGNGYPLAAELAAILSAMADSLSEFVRAPEQTRHESTLRLCTDIEQSLTRVARLPFRVGMIAGAWRGDREAAFDACRALDLVLSGCVAMLERVPPTHMDTRPAVREVITLREAVATAVRTLATKP